jgi:hypothetical protein
MIVVPRIEELAAFMRERHGIYLKRKAGEPGPWTSDPVLQSGRFCNVFRELDTVTQWIDKNIRKPYADHEHLWFMLAIARYVNWPETLAELMHNERCWPVDDKWDPSMLTFGLEKRARRGDKVYTGAYMIRAESDPKAPWYSWTKHRYISEIVLGRLWERREEWQEYLRHCENRETGTGLQATWDRFQEHFYIGWGPFMAYEVVTDLRHTRYLRRARDIMTWANAGPGAIRGLNRMYGRDLDHKPAPSQTNNEMIMTLLALNVVMTFWPGAFPRLEMRDVEHSLCEFDKFERVRLGQGKMRCKYDWKKAKPL